MGSVNSNRQKPANTNSETIGLRQHVKIPFLTVTLGLLLQVQSWGQTFTTIAGMAGNAGSSDGTGTNALFNAPFSVAVDEASNVYVAERYNHTIRKITPAGVVTVVAGLAGEPGSADGLGSEARFNQPLGVCVDGAGNLYVADYNSHTLRKVSSSGLVTTLAGSAGDSGSRDGVGSLARFNGPLGIALDSAANIYVTDFNSNRLRKVSPTGNVTTLTTGLIYPAGLAVDKENNVYVANWANNNLVRVTPAGDVTEVARGFHGPSGVALDEAGNVYVSNTSGHTIDKVDPQGVVTTIAGLVYSSGAEDGPGNVARFKNPQGLALDKAGNLFVADTDNHTIRHGLTSAQPAIHPSFGNMGFTMGQFWFDLSGSAGQSFIVEESTNLLFWTPIVTNKFGTGPFYFTDPASKGMPTRFYRARLP